MSKALAVEVDGAQALKRAPVLMPALVSQAYDYFVPANAPVGALVEAKLANKTRIGAVWDGAMDATLPDAKIKSVARVLDLPPLNQAYRDWLAWMSDYTLAPLGAVLSLAGLAHAAKATRAAYKPPLFVPTLPTLTDAQANAAAKLLDGGAVLLDGVTGSGKTEVYFHAIADVLAAGKQVLVLLPEIALTHQWLERFQKSFGAQPTVWHSKQTPAARAKAWQGAARGQAQLIVGARSALFLPFRDLGLIIIDEEHDPSYKQDEGVLYHARDMAVARARFEKIPIVLVSATPSLETTINVEEGKYRTVHLHERFGKAGMPQVKLVDMVAAPPERGDFLSPAVRAGMLAALEKGEQALLFLNRRGYAPLLLCRACGHRFECADCSAWMVVHGRGAPAGESLSRVAEGEPPREGGQRSEGGGLAHPFHATKSRTYLSCHHCGHRDPMPKECPACKAEADKLVACGPGVERIAEEVKLAFPEQRIAVLSSDEAIAADTWAAIERGEVDILVGTQMVAKGHHFPRLTFVGVVDADVGLQGADLRAGERTYQLLHQLGGRAGRGDAAGTVLIQTYQPQHPIMQALIRHDRDAVMGIERQLRQQGGWPPYGQLAAILLDGVNESAVRAAGQTLARRAPSDPRLRVLGPAPAPLSKLRGQYRYRLLVKAQPGISLQRTLKAWLGDAKFKGVRIKVDVNPYYFL